MLARQLRADPDAQRCAERRPPRDGRRPRAADPPPRAGPRGLDRALEFLPDDEVLAERGSAGRGLDAPELAVLLAYSKIDLYDELLDSDVPEDPVPVSRELADYFPPPLPERYGRAMRDAPPAPRDHRDARRQPASSHGAGTTFAFRLHEETGAPASDIARAYAIAREVFAHAPTLWGEIEALDNRSPPRRSRGCCSRRRRLVERGDALAAAQPPPAAGHRRHRGALRARRRDPLRVGAVAPGLRDGRHAEDRARAPSGPACRPTWRGGSPPGLDVRRARHRRGGRGDRHGGRAGRRCALPARRRLELHWLRDRIADLPRDDRWSALARAALRDDLYTLHRALTAEVLRGARRTATSRSSCAGGSMPTRRPSAAWRR